MLADSPLCVPDVSGMDTVAAALAYASSGFFVCPTDPADIKNPGSVLGKKWQESSTRAPADLLAWFDGDYGGDRSRGIALHLGKSGAVGIDVDNPGALPAWLESELLDSRTPFQLTQTDSQTRPDGHSRGHRIFLMPPGRRIGNRVPPELLTAPGDPTWGEMRGLNGVIVAAPTVHPRSATGGVYQWVRIGPVQPLPARLLAALPDATPLQGLPAVSTHSLLDRFSRAGSVPSAAVAACLASGLGALAAAASLGAGRHDAMNATVLRLVRLGEMGHGGVVEALGIVRLAFSNAVGTARLLEWDRGLAGALAAVAGRPSLPDGWELGTTEDHERWKERSRLEGQVNGPFDNLDQPGSNPGNPGPAEDPLELEIAAQVRWLTIASEARRRFAAKDVPAKEVEFITGDALLAESDVEAQYRIDRIWPTNGRIMVVAQNKAGKTTLMGNMIHSLVDKTQFLNTFDVVPVVRNVAVIDLEMDREQIKRWLRKYDIKNVSSLGMFFVRGSASAFNILDPKVRASWASRLRDAGTDVVVFDCVRPALDALGLDEHKDAGKFLVAFDELLMEAGISEAAVVHHMGHTNERGRGDSRLGDWPDATWKIVLEDEEDKMSPRYFSAYGRDVEFAEDQLWYDSLTHHMQLTGTGSRKKAKSKATNTDNDEKYNEIKAAIFKVLRQVGGPISKAQVKLAVGGNSNPVRVVLDDLISKNLILSDDTGKVGVAIKVWLPKA